MAWLMWSMGALFYGYEFLVQVSPSVMVPELTGAFHVTAAALGGLAALYLYAYGVMQIPVGMLLDRFGARWVLPVAVLICMLGCLLFGGAHSLDVARVGRILLGVGSAFALIGSLHLIAHWFPPRRFAFLTGLLVAIGMIGAALGEAPLALLVDTFGWRESMYLFAVIGGVISLLMLLFLRERPIDPQQQTVDKKHFGESLNIVLKNPQTSFAAIYAALMFMPTTAFAELWGVPFLMQADNLPRPLAAFLVSMIFVGWAVGSPFFGYISDRLARRKVPMYVASIGTFFSICCIIYLTHLFWGWLLCFCFLFGFFSSGFMLAFSIAKEANPFVCSATSLGYTNMLNMLGGALIQPLVGVLIDYHRGVGNSAPKTALSLQHFQFALTLVPAVVVLSLVFLFFIKETHTLQAE